MDSSPVTVEVEKNSQVLLEKKETLFHQQPFLLLDAPAQDLEALKYFRFTKANNIWNIASSKNQLDMSQMKYF